MKEFLKRLKFNEGNLGLGLGVMVMIAAGVLLVNYFKTNNKVEVSDNISSASTEVSPTYSPLVTDQQDVQVSNSVIQPGSEYVVQTGDSLWKIAAKTFGSGYEWNKIYEANKEVLGNNPGKITVGSKIVIPQTEIAESVITEHTVVSGDNLWNISLKYCGSGFQYPAIAAQNNIEVPRLIRPGQILKVACPVLAQK